MELYKGYKVNTVEDYEVKQNEIVENENLNLRYAGRIDEGVTIPDVKLIDDTFFIFHEDGTDTITSDDIIVE